MITLIAAMGISREIGVNNKLLWDLPKDMAHFRSRTKGKTIVMGRKTFESIGFPLPKRRNIILTRDTHYAENHEGIETMFSVDEVLKLSQTEDLIIIGGEIVYNLFMPHATDLCITHVDAKFSEADSFFPKISLEEFSIKEGFLWKADEDNEFDMTQLDYVRR